MDETIATNAATGVQPRTGNWATRGTVAAGRGIALVGLTLVGLVLWVAFATAVALAPLAIGLPAIPVTVRAVRRLETRVRRLAGVCSPFPSCFGAAFQVTGTPDNALWEWTTAPPLTGGSPGARTPIRTIPNGYTLYVGCQINDGLQEDGEVNYHDGVYYASQTWDFAWDPQLQQFVWVYDWWMNTPPQNFNYNWYSWPDAAHHCA